MTRIIKAPLTSEEKDKIESDLDFLKKLIKFSKTHKYRVVVSGGYGLDGIIGKITRFHNDLDVIIYSSIKRNKIVEKISKFVKKTLNKPKISLHSNQFMHTIDINSSGFGGNVYVVQTKNDPHQDLNTLILHDGAVHKNNPKLFPPPTSAKLQYINFEAQDSSAHLADILYKRRKETNQKKHEQDIQNLKQITDSKKVEEIISLY